MVTAYFITAMSLDLFNMDVMSETAAAARAAEAERESEKDIFEGAHGLSPFPSTGMHEAVVIQAKLSSATLPFPPPNDNACLLSSP